jgi:hypothetical protein
MSYGSYSYGSAPLGGSAAGAIVLYPATQNLTVTLHIPVWVAKHSNPAFFALNLAIAPPTLKITQGASVQALSLSIGGPGKEIAKESALFPLSLTQETPTASLSIVPSVLTMGLSFEASEHEVEKEPALFSMTLTLESATVVIEIKHQAHYNELKLKSPKSPHWSDLTPRIVRYIKDPQVTGGCAQCGTFLYADVRGRMVLAESVTRGRNFDLGDYTEDSWIRCGRCGFINHPIRNIKDKEGSRTGWGMKYVEVEAGSE